MPITLAINDKLIEEVRRIGGHATKKDAVTAALDEYIRRRKQVEIVKLFGTIEYERGYDHKTNRRRDRINPGVRSRAAQQP
jgi:NADPH-dependent 2,4-dienoyl-CoA reductase/sulfur reductase-like enzyme